MSGVKISALPAVASALTTDYFPVVQAGVTSRETLAQVQTLFGFVAGVLPLANGGTSKALTADNGGIVYSDADSFEILAHVTTAGKVLQSGNATAPTWSTPTYPSASGTVGKILRSDGTNNVYTTSTFADTYAVSTVLYASSANVVGGLATTNRAAFATSATGVPQWLALTDGQIVIGSTAGAPAAANLSAGPGVSISSGSNSITISGTGSGIGWTEVTGATQAMSADSGYVANRATLITFTLPATAAFGTVLSVIGKGAGGFIIAQNALQNIQIGSSSSTVGAGGSVASSNRFDSLDLICTTANTTWTAQGGVQGALTIV